MFSIAKKCKTFHFHDFFPDFFIKLKKCKIVSFSRFFLKKFPEIKVQYRYNFTVFFTRNESCQKLKSAKPLYFHDFFTGCQIRILSCLKFPRFRWPCYLTPNCWQCSTSIRTQLILFIFLINTQDQR